LCDHLLARFEAVEADQAGRQRGRAADHAVGDDGAGFGDGAFQGQHNDHRQAVAQADGVVVEVVGGGDLDHAGAELAVDVFVGDDRDVAVDQRQLDGLADQVGVALILRMHHHGGVAEHGFRAGGGHGEAAAADRPAGSSDAT
jgi:hypothetical protein